MTLQPPNLDDRTYEDLLRAARDRATRSHPEWSELSPADPGVTLLELFAYLTDTLLYRVNRLPEKAYVELLRLMGVQLHPPSAAVVHLRFERADQEGDRPCLLLPEGVTVTPKAGGPRFRTLRPAEIPEGADAVEVVAAHVERISGQLLGRSSGDPGQVFQCGGPIVRPHVSDTGADLFEVRVGIEAVSTGAVTGRVMTHEGASYEVWTEVDHFSEQGAQRTFMVDRASGEISFSPFVPTSTSAASGIVPPEGRLIRAWYFTGGGEEGSIAAGQITEIDSAESFNLQVTNPSRAVGGVDGESLQQALLRGPAAFRSRDRIVTARDYESYAMDLATISRASAQPMVTKWPHAAPGTVEIVVVPSLPGVRAGKTKTMRMLLRDHQTADVLDDLCAGLDDRRPLGSTVHARWVDYCEVEVHADLLLQAGAEQEHVKEEVSRSVDSLINPVADRAAVSTGWNLEEPLQAGRVYERIHRVPGVARVERLRLVLADTPETEIVAVEADGTAVGVWYCLTSGGLHRSTSDGAIWHRIESAPSNKGQLTKVSAHRTAPGRVALIQAFEDEHGPTAILHTSSDCGTTWTHSCSLRAVVHDIVWTAYDGVPALLLATDRGLFRWIESSSTPLEQILMAGLEPGTGFWTVATLPDAAGDAIVVAASAKSGGGVWMSHDGGLPMTYIEIGLTGRDVRALAFDGIGRRARLWAGDTVVGALPANGAFRWTGRGKDWDQIVRGWSGGSCVKLVAHGNTMLAASHSGGVVTTQTQSNGELGWSIPDLDSGLPRRSSEYPFARVSALATSHQGRTLIAGGARGLVRSLDGGATWSTTGQREFIDSIPLERDTLFTAGRHHFQFTEER